MQFLIALLLIGQVPPNNWGVLETNEGPGVVHEYVQGPAGIVEELTPSFRFDPERFGTIMSGTSTEIRASSAYNITQSNGVFTLVSVGTNVLRVVDHPTLGKGYWGEFAATNLSLRSEELDNATWSATLMTVNADVGTGADGTTTAEGLEATGTGVHKVRQTMALGSTGATVFSAFMAPGDQTWGLLIYDDPTFFQYFDLSTGTPGTGGGVTDAGCEGPYPSGAYRCWMLITTVSATDIFDIAPAEADADASFTGTGSDSIIAWGGMAERGLVMTSYIQTTSASVQRFDDNLSYPMVDGVDYSSTAGTLVTELTCPDYNNATQLRYLQMGPSSANRIIHFIAATDALQSSSTIASTPVWTINGATDVTSGVRFDFRTSFGLNDIEVYFNRVSIGTDTLATVLTPANDIDIGHAVTVNEAGCVFHNVRVYTRKRVLQ